MLEQIQKTAAGFVRSASRRMDVELCLVNLCRPELQLDAESLNVRLTRLEDQIKSGVVAVAPQKPQPVAEVEEEEEYLPVPDDSDAPPEADAPAAVVEEDPAAASFWVEICGEIRKELRPPVSGFFTQTPNSPVHGVMKGDTILLVCANAFTKQIVDKPEVLELVARKVSAKFGRPIRAKACDKAETGGKSAQMEQLLRFGREHSDVIHIK
jgi:DNA polymerase-3 subunit gamma/tau